MKHRRLLSLLLLTAMLASTACGGDAPAADTTDAANADTTTAAAPETDAYDWPDIDLGGREITILNIPLTLWNLNADLDFEAQTGEVLDDVIFNRNRDLEERYNFKLNVINNSGYHSGELINTEIQRDVVSGDGMYDAAYANGGSVASLITEGMLSNLLDYEELQFDQPWWVQETMKSAIIGDNQFCYFAHSYLSLTAFDLTWCMYFNEDMMADLGMETPYQLVRDGKWTLDKLREYTKVGANLNGDDSFAWNENGKAVYGLSGYNNCAFAHIIALGGVFCEKDAKGTPQLVVSGDKMNTICEKLAQLYGTAGEFYLGASGTYTVAGGYMTAFYHQRALFLAAEVKTSVEMRDLNATFGVVPNPKLDENQENYRSFSLYSSPVLTIPKTSKNPHDTALVLDALSYLSYRDVLPVYYDVTVSQKGLRNEDSIEMLDIIRGTIYYSADMSYGWSMSIANALRDTITAGNGSVASVIASNLPAAQAAIDKMMGELDA